MVMDVLLNVYQAVWAKKIGEKKELLIKNFPKIKEIGFWNAPEKVGFSKKKFDWKKKFFSNL